MVKEAHAAEGKHKAMDPFSQGKVDSHALIQYRESFPQISPKKQQNAMELLVHKDSRLRWQVLWLIISWVS
jgi:hypothetical protein